jgi:hypothetical protein
VAVVPCGRRLVIAEAAGEIQRLEAHEAAITFAMAVVDGLTCEFVAPLMYARRYAATGFRDLLRYVRDDPASFALYLLVRVVGSILVGVVAVALSCMTCGLAGLPVVGTLILLPLLVYLRTLSIEFVAQLGDDLRTALT